MILAIDIGNTTVTLGGVRIAPQQAYSLEFTARIDINHTWSASQYESAIEQLFEDKNLSPSDFRGVIISSVVPSVLTLLQECVRNLFGTDQELLQEIETFDTDKAEMIYLYIPEDTGAGMSFAITREDHPEEMDEILSTIYGEKISCQKPKQVFNMTERILYDYNWYVLIYDHEMNQMALVFLYSDDVIVYNGHVLQTTETYDESIRPCILKLKEENQEKLKSGEATQRRVTIP